MASKKRRVGLCIVAALIVGSASTVCAAEIEVDFMYPHAQDQVLTVNNGDVVIFQWAAGTTCTG